MSKLLIFVTILISLPLQAVTNVVCTHIEVCKLLKSNSQTSLTNIEIKKGDPHEFEPTSNDIKNLLNAEYLVVGPLELNPWIKNVLVQRNKNRPNSTINLIIDKKYISYYQNGSLEALSHFWLYPQISCDLKRQLSQNSIILKLGINSDANCDVSKIEKAIIDQLKNNQQLFVFSHDALAPFIRTYAPQIKFITLKGSGHHEEISPASIKALYNFQKANSLTWIVENNINIPNSISSKIRPMDKVIKIDTSMSNDYVQNLPKEFINFSTIYKFITSISQ